MELIVVNSWNPPFISSIWRFVDVSNHSHNTLKTSSSVRVELEFWVKSSSMGKLQIAAGSQ